MWSLAALRRSGCKIGDHDGGTSKLTQGEMRQGVANANVQIGTCPSVRDKPASMAGYDNSYIARPETEPAMTNPPNLAVGPSEPSRLRQDR